MYKKNAVIVAVILAALAVFVVVAATAVFKDDSEERYQNTPSPQAEATIDDKSAVSPTSVKDETTQPLEQNEVGGLNETATEHMEDANEAVPETVVDEVAEVGQTFDSMEDVPATPAQAEEVLAEEPSTDSGEIHIVKAVGLKYDPLVVEIQANDTVAWENMPTHDTQSLEGLIPEGAEMWHSTLGENYERTFSVEGIYVYKCTPHFGAGMGGAIIVGKPVNLEAIKSADAKGAAGRLVRKAIAAAEAM
ncbi:plastocyanin/azurin family copper-binding protein [Methylophaga sp.]|uniref:plastocyanin/azurin family copper-binding protein n=1 Tax=Methylophaga sp. TaxID=2024840 RepID=UPI003F69C881